MTQCTNHAPVSNQAGIQNVHGNVIFNDFGPSHKRSRRDTPGLDSEQSLDDDILASLAFPQMLDRKSNVEPAHPQTCQWLFDLAEYQHWSSETCGLLWIQGKPGSGKSTLVSHLHHTLLLELRQKEAHVVNLEFFFSARGTQLQRTFIGMLRSLLNQIFCHDSDVRHYLRAIYREKSSFFGRNSGPHPWEWTLPELKRLLIDTISASAQTRQVILLVDALDEAGEDAAREVVRYIHSMNGHIIKSKGQAKICISCRHYPILIDTEAEVAMVCVEKHNSGDITLYVRDHIGSGSLPNAYQQSLDVITDTIVSKAGGVFQWVRLVTSMTMKYLSEGETTEQILTNLSEVPRSLEAVYEHILTNIVGPKYLQKTLRLFQWVCLAQRPLSIIEIRYALSAESIRTENPPVKCHAVSGFEKSGLTMSRRITVWSGGLLEAVSSGLDTSHDKKIVQVIHQSVNEFMLTKGLPLLLATSNSDRLDDRTVYSLRMTSTEAVQISHSILYLSCLKYLCTERLDSTLFKNEDSLTNREAMETQHPLLKYAACWSLSHASKSGSFRTSDLERESLLLSQSLHTWVGSLDVWRDYIPVPPVWTGATVLHLASIANLLDLTRYRIECGDSPDEKDVAGWTPLHVAAYQGHLATVILLLESGANGDSRSVSGETPLFLAASCGHRDIFSFLLGNEADIHAANRDSETILYAAAWVGSLDIVRLCLEAGANVNAQGGYHGSVLQAVVVPLCGRYIGDDETYDRRSEAFRILLTAGADINAHGGFYGNVLQGASTGYGCRSHTIIRALIDAGADVNAQGGFYGNALQGAVRGADNTDNTRLLLQAGADVNARGGPYGNALQAAALGPHSCGDKIIKVLLEAGASIAAQGGFYGNALQAAAWNGDIDKAKLLLQAGADINAQGGEYGNALQAAMVGTRNKSLSYRMVKLLLEAGANVNAQGGCYENALQAVVSKEGCRSHKIMRMLIEAGADINAQGGEYGNALQAAVIGANNDDIDDSDDGNDDDNNDDDDDDDDDEDDFSYKAVRFLLDTGADVNAQGGPYGSALEAAAAAGPWDIGRNSETVKLLLEAGADVNAQGGRYGNALSAALKTGRVAIADILKAAVAKSNKHSDGDNDCRRHT